MTNVIPATPTIVKSCFGLRVGVRLLVLFFLGEKPFKKLPIKGELSWVSQVGGGQQAQRSRRPHHRPPLGLRRHSHDKPFVFSHRVPGLPLDLTWARNRRHPERPRAAGTVF